MKTIALYLCLQIFPWMCSKNINITLNHSEIENSDSRLKFEQVGVISDPDGGDRDLLIVSLSIENLQSKTIVFESWKVVLNQGSDQLHLGHMALPYVNFANVKENIPPRGKVKLRYAIKLANSTSTIDIKSSGIRNLLPAENKFFIIETK